MTAMAARTIPPALESSKPVQTALRRLRASHERLEAAKANHADTRRQVVVELHDAGLSYDQISGLIGITKSRVFQIARGQ